MEPVNLKEARRRLSELVGAAERGETVVSTRRGKQVARIVPPEENHQCVVPDLTDFRRSIRLKGKAMSTSNTDTP